MKYSLIIDPEISFEQLQQEISNGGKFIVFPYCISLIFAVTLRRLSPPIFITDTEQFRKHARKYRTISLIFGWWCLPWGIVRTLKSLNLIRQGGLDVTKDIMLNLDAESLAAKEVDLKLIHDIYIQPNNSDIKSMKKMLAPVFLTDQSIHKIIAVMFVNAEKPYYVIGLKADSLATFYADTLRAALHKDFYKSVRFDFIDLDSEDGIVLKEQGVVLFDRNNPML